MQSQQQERPDPQVIRKFIIDNFLFGQIRHGFQDDDSFLEGGIIDSTGVLELIAFLEQRYGIKVDDDDLVPENLDSVGRVVAYVQRKSGM